MPMPLTESKPETRRAPPRKRLRIAIPVVVALVLIIAALSVYFSPQYSWSASIRDSDGDSFSDGEDAWPDDPSRIVALTDMSTSYADEVWTISVTSVRDAHGETSVPASDILVEAAGGVYGEDRLQLTNLRTISYQSNHGVRFVDSDQDAGLSEGDSFHLDMPAYAAGSEFGLSKSQTSFVGGNLLSYCYVELTLETPLVSADVSSFPGGWKYTFSDPVPRTIHWGEVAVMMPPSPLGWRLYTLDLTGSSTMTANLGGHYYDMLTRFYLNVTDMSGDGEIDTGDYFTMTVSSSSSANMLYTVYVIYEPTGHPMSTSGFPVLP